MEGVGKADIHVDCDRLRASMEGVGSVTLSGRARQADISKESPSVKTNRTIPPKISPSRIYFSLGLLLRCFCLVILRSSIYIFFYI